MRIREGIIITPDKCVRTLPTRAQMTAETTVRKGNIVKPPTPKPYAAFDAWARNPTCANRAAMLAEQRQIEADISGRIVKPMTVKRTQVTAPPVPWDSAKRFGKKIVPRELK